RRDHGRASKTSLQSRQSIRSKASKVLSYLLFLSSRTYARSLHLQGQPDLFINSKIPLVLVQKKMRLRLRLTFPSCLPRWKGLTFQLQCHIRPPETNEDCNWIRLFSSA